MIAVDTSALMAIVLREPERSAMIAALDATDTILISSGTLIEVRLVCFRKGGQSLVEDVNALIEAIGIQAVPVCEQETLIAHAAFVQFGKGNGHSAQLNFGDLFAYALAKARGIPLLFKGADFAATDVVPALTG